MYHPLKNFSERVLNSKYLSRWVVLMIDSFISASATLTVYLFFVYFVRGLFFAEILLNVALISFVITFIIFFLFGIHRGIMRHTTIYEIVRIFLAVVIKAIVLFVIFAYLRGYYLENISILKLCIVEFCDVFFSVASLVLFRMFLVFIYELFMSSNNKLAKRVLIYGDDSKSIALANFLSKKLHAKYRVIGFLKKQGAVSNLKLQGINLYTINDYNSLKKIVISQRINTIIFPSQRSALIEKDGILDFCVKEHIKVCVLPHLNEISVDNGITSQIRDIKIEDLLGREEIVIDLDEISSFLSGKKVMVTGGAGSIGSELARLISSFPISQLIIYDNSETPLHNIKLELSDMQKKKLNDKFSVKDFENKFKFIIGDIRIIERLDKIFEHCRPDVVFHAAAYKHVPLMEENPCEAINTNVFGTMNIANCAVKYNVEKMVMISTDKAVNPTNVMGCSKRLAEIYVQSLSQAIISGEVKGRTKFITTRFGNVLGSNGSVIPRFNEQIKAGGPVTVTHKDIIRYFMTIPEACRLVMEAATMGCGYEIFVFDMGEPVKISDLASKMISLAGFIPDKDIKIQYTGLRPGEKLYEELLNDKEYTIPTGHNKIFVAKVREYNFKDVVAEYENFKSKITAFDKEGTVKLMKKIVPEFLSQNSVYSNLDKTNENE